MINNKGRPKGSKGSHHTTIKMSQLREYLGNEANVVVSRRWLAQMGILVEDNKSVVDKPQIEYTVE